MMAAHNVIVFGPSGAVGSSTARTASELGAKVTLAMRDTSKAIPGLDADTEKKRGCERVYADLTKPETVGDAVTKSQAQYAFIYLAHGTADHMKATLEALKSAGIKLVVFLSSFTIQGDPKDIPPMEIIPFVHGRVEMNLREVFGPEGYVAARGGGFASNVLQYKEGIQKGEVTVFMPEATVDCIAPEDIGRVCGTILAKGVQDEQRAIYIYGPKLQSSADTINVVAKALGKEIKIKTANEQEAFEIFSARGIPPPVVKYMIAQTGKKVDGQNTVWGVPVTEDQLRNVEKYSGHKATTFEEWVEKHKHKLTA